MRNIKHLLLVVVIAIFTCGSAHADFRFGVKAGLNVNKMHFNEKTFDADNRCGFTAGVMTEFTVPLIGVGADLSVMYTRMNSGMNKAFGQEGVLPEKQNLGKDFIEIPLNIKYKLTLPAVASIVKPMVYTGPTMALKLKDVKDAIFDTKRVQMGWNIGIGLELIKHLQISGGYTFGINNVVKHFNVPGNVSLTDVKIKNNYWTVTAAWLF